MNPTLELALVCMLLITTAALVTRRSRLTVQVATLAVAVTLCVPIAEKWAADVRAHRVITKLDSYRPVDLTRSVSSPFAGSRACQACHPSEYATWANSYHRTMTQSVTAATGDDTVLADFNDVTLRWQGRRYRAFRQGKQFMVDVPRVGTTGEASGDRIVRPVVMSTGSHNQQLYWYPLPDADEGPSPVAEGIYYERCASCHGENGIGGVAPGLTGSEIMADRIVAALNASTHKPLPQPRLSDQEVDAMVRFVLRMQLVDRLMQFPFSWIVADGRWVHEDLTFLGPSYEPTEEEPYDQGWSNSCDGCHAVGARFEAPDAGRLGRAAVVELGISCEVCHGAAQKHVQRHRNPLARYQAHDSSPSADANDFDIVNPTRLSPSRNAAVCGQCHAETVEKIQPPKNGFKPGDRLEDHTNVLQLQAPPYPLWLAGALAGEEDLLESGFWGDGTIRIAGRDYNGITQTGCHTAGELTCTTCHTLHGDDPDDQLKPEARSNAVCVKCHASIDSDLSAHTHHAPESSGSECYNCHMPHTTWGLLGAKRAHRITSPSAEVSLSTGRPNACNLCHLDRSLPAMGQVLTDWYGHAPPTGPQAREQHMPDDVSAALVWLIRGNGVQRAVAAWHFGWAPALQTTDPWWAAPLLARALNDPYAAVRYVAGKSLSRHAGFEDFVFDYAADPDALYRERRRAIARWVAPAGKTQPSALMFTGGLDYGRLQALEILRDTRPASINE